MIDLKTAIKEGRLDDFIAQAEADGVGSVNEAALMEALEATI